jgi:hypothetical protein
MHRGNMVTSPWRIGLSPDMHDEITGLHFDPDGLWWAAINMTVHH